MTRAILFDLDDTLMDRGATLAQYLEGQVRRFGLPAAQHPLYFQRFLDLDQQGHGNKMQLFLGIQEFFPQYTPQQLIEDFDLHAWQAPVLYPRTYTTLLELRSMGIKLGLITNGTVQNQRAKIAFSKLSEYLDVHLISEAEGLAKPDPQLFQRAADRLKVLPRQCIFVGDHPEKDIVGAAKAGMKTAWVHHKRLWQHNEVQPDWLLDSVRDLVPVVARQLPLNI